MNQSGWPYCSVFAALIFCPPPMWWIVIRLVFLVCRQKYALRGGKLWPFIFSPIPLFSRFSLSTDFQLFFELFPSGIWFFWRVLFFKNKLSGKNGATAELNFWHSKYQSGFLAILLFSCGVSFKIVSVQQFFGDKVVSGRSRPFKAICLG